jgi:hypothetical protein
MSLVVELLSAETNSAPVPALRVTACKLVDNKRLKTTVKPIIRLLNNEILIRVLNVLIIINIRINLIQIWEHDYKNNKKYILNILNLFIKNKKNKILKLL